MSECDDDDDDDVDISPLYYCAHLGKTLTTEDDLDTEDLKDDERERDVMVGEDGRSNVMSLVLVVNSW